MTARTSPVFTLTPGPAGATPATLAALGQPILHHQDPAFRALYAETVELLRRAFGTADDPVIFPGEAVVGLEAAAASLIAPGDVVLNLVSGVFGRAFGETARQYAGEVIEIEVGYDSAIPPGRVRDVLRARPDVGIVSVVHCETPCGIVNDVDAIAAEMAGHGALLLVDAVSSFGGIRCDPGRADLVVVAPQKCLGGPPGLSLLHVSEAAWRHMAANPRPPAGAALSLAAWRDAHRRAFPYTPPVAEIHALHSCLGQYLAEGPDAALARHRSAARAARAGARALGLKLWAADEATCADTVTAVRMPDGVGEADVRATARTESGVMLSGGQDGLPVVQIGHMGPAAYPLGPVIALVALGRALRRLGAAADVGAAVEAALGEDPFPGAGLSGITALSGLQRNRPSGHETAPESLPKSQGLWVSHPNPRGVTLLANHSSGQCESHVTRRRFRREGFGADHKVFMPPCSSDGHAALSTAAMVRREPDKPFLTRRDRFERKRRPHSPAQPHHSSSRTRSRRPCPARPRRLRPYHVPAVGE